MAVGAPSHWESHLERFAAEMKMKLKLKLMMIMTMVMMMKR